MKRGNNNFWEAIKPPILALAPMAGFSDAAFRRLCREQGADVLYSEMVSAAALYYAKPSGAAETWKLMEHSRRQERPFVVQIFGSKPEHFAKAARLISAKVKPDGLDINLGCPVPKVIKQGAGAALMQDLGRARQVIEAVLENTSLPVSIKVRSKSGSVSLEDFLKEIKDLPLAALMIHGRSLSQGFAGSADWAIARLARPLFAGRILINGDIDSLTKAKQALRESQADGLGLARGVLGQPWLFREIKQGRTMEMNDQEILAAALRHASLNYRLKGQAGLLELRKHLVWYAKGRAGASALRQALVKAESLADLRRLLKLKK